MIGECRAHFTRLSTRRICLLSYWRFIPCHVKYHVHNSTISIVMVIIINTIFVTFNK